MNLFQTNIDKEKYVIVTYHVQSSKNLAWAAHQIASGQSVSNPNVHCKYETPELIENHACRILHSESDLKSLQFGTVRIAFPLVNFNLKEDGISQLLCLISGGQSDISYLEKCRVVDIQFPPNSLTYFKGPKYGISGIRNYTKVYDKPLLLGILKPKIVISPEILVGMTTELIEGGCNLIKEDECMSNQDCLPLKDRVKLIAPLIKNTNVIYFHCINSDFPYLSDRAKYIADNGGNGIHVNFWAGLGAYKTLRELDLPLFMHFQRSGIRCWTDPTNPYSISWPVICKLAGMIGVDTIHTGMIGGYGNDNEIEIFEALKILRNLNSLPTLSCGFTPGLVQHVNKKVGNDYAIGAGGSLHAHPGGSKAGTTAMRQAIDQTGGNEYNQAIKEWGLVQ